MTTSFPLIRVACAMAALAFSATASAGIDVSTSLTGLRYRVIDLDPNDGIKAAVTFTGGDPLFNMYDYSRLWGSGGTPVPVAGQPFAAEPTSFDGGPGLAKGVATADGYTLSATVPTNQLLNAQLLADKKSLIEAPYSSGAQLHLAGAQAASALAPDGIRWTLTPNTALIVEGTVNAQLKTDLNDLDRNLLKTYVDDQGGHFDVHAYASTGLYLSTPDARTLSGQRFVNAGSGTEQTVSWSRNGDAVLTNGSLVPDNGSFELRMDNTDHNAMTGMLGFSSTLFASSQIGGLLNEPAPSVPEPGTWALMSLGIVGLAAAAKCRRQPA